MMQIDIQAKVTASVLKVGGHFPVEIVLTNASTENKLLEVDRDSKFEFQLKSQQYGTFVISETRYDNATYVYGDRPKPVTPRQALKPGESISFKQDISNWYVRILPADTYQLTVRYTGLHGGQISSKPIPVRIHGVAEKHSGTAKIAVDIKVSSRINIADAFPVEIILTNQDSGKNSANSYDAKETSCFEFEFHSKDRGMFMISKALYEGESNAYKNSEAKFVFKSLPAGESLTYKMDIAPWRKSFIPEDEYQLVVHYMAPDGEQYSSKPVWVQIN